jgi:zinc transporter ZupT
VTRRVAGALAACLIYATSAAIALGITVLIVTRSADLATTATLYAFALGYSVAILVAAIGTALNYHDNRKDNRP